jgi:hypothetical protein
VLKKLIGAPGWYGNCSTSECSHVLNRETCRHERRCEHKAAIAQRFSLYAETKATRVEIETERKGKIWRKAIRSPVSINAKTAAKYSLHKGNLMNTRKIANNNPLL